MKKSRIIVLFLAVAAALGAFLLANAPKDQPQVVVGAAPPPPPPPATDDVAGRVQRSAHGDDRR